MRRPQTSVSCSNNVLVDGHRANTQKYSQWFCNTDNRDNPIVITSDNYWSCRSTDVVPAQLPTTCVKNVLHYSDGITHPWYPLLPSPSFRRFYH